MAMSYALQGHDSDLKKHVGHRVEITGTLDPRSEHTTGSTSGATSTTGTTAAGTTATGATSAGTSGAATGHDDMNRSTARIRVASVRMIGEDCSSR
jgi:hypothetical protein